MTTFTTLSNHADIHSMTHAIDLDHREPSDPTAGSSGDSGSLPEPASGAEQDLHRVSTECHGLDTNDRVCFYEQEFYPLSNFSSFTLRWKGYRFDTSEAAYHWEKFPGDSRPLPMLREIIRDAISAHEAFKIAENNALLRRPDWDALKVDVMRQILRAKVDQHEYVRRKLLETGDRELVENSWRDSFWGWGPNRDGQNQLGKLWMEIRAELRKPTP